MRIASRRQTLLVILFAGVFLAGCQTVRRTFDYREVHNEWNQAVAADNMESLKTPGSSTSGDAARGYENVAAKLDDQHISQLDDRLKPNAYALRAMAQWRLGRLHEARETALKGLNLPNVADSPRDRLVLKIVPALVIDAELVAKFQAAGGNVTEAEYNAVYSRDFGTAARMLKEAVANVDPATPDSIIAFVHAQRWRVLQNWKIVISRTGEPPPRDAEVRARARAAARSLLGQELNEEISGEERLVPAESDLRMALTAMVAT